MGLKVWSPLVEVEHNCRGSVSALLASSLLPLMQPSFPLKLNIAERSRLPAAN